MHGAQRGGASFHSEFVGADDSVRPFPVIPSQCEHWRGNPSPQKRKTDCRCAPLQDAVPYRRFNIPSRRTGPACPAAKYALPPAGHMGPALQVHTPPKKTTRRPLRGAARFPSMCGTDGGGLYSPLLQAGTAGEIPPKGGKGANLLGYDEPIAVLRGPATLAENDLTRFSVNGINSRNAGIVIPKRAAIDCNRAACSRVILMI